MVAFDNKIGDRSRIRWPLYARLEGCRRPINMLYSVYLAFHGSLENYVYYSVMMLSFNWNIALVQFQQDDYAS